MKTASGFDLEPLANGNILIEFYGTDGATINQQVITLEVVRNMPLVALLTQVAVQKGPDVVKKIMEMLAKDEAD